MNIINLVDFKADENNTERLKIIDEHDYRSKFQRDRDRILYSKEFRRLSGKTQIFISGYDDNMRTRLTHTLEVAQIAETISRKLRLDEMLTVAIAYGHDVGHTPFGHVGERTLNSFMNGCFDYHGYFDNMIDDDKGFKHNFQGVRVVCFLESLSSEYKTKEYGLNLTKYTLWGILNHSSLKYKQCEYCDSAKNCTYKNRNKQCKGLSLDFYKNSLIDSKGNYIFDDKRDWTFEAIVVSYADEIAQRHHDIEDGIFAGIIDLKQFCEYLLDVNGFNDSFKNEIINIKNNHNKQNLEISINKLSRIIVDYYVTCYIDSVLFKINELYDKGVFSKEDNNKRDLIYDYIKNEGVSIINFFGFNKEFRETDKAFNNYLCNHILNSELAQCMDGKATYVIRKLFKAYLTNPQQLPDKTIISIIRNWEDDKGVHFNDDEKCMTTASSCRTKLKLLLNQNDLTIHRILLRRICDYIAGMTDDYALKCYAKLYGEKKIM